MAFGQIDPARLEGDALRSWYLRSPSEIEEERRQAAARAHDAFFSQYDNDRPPGADPKHESRLASTPDNSAIQWTSLGGDGGRAEPTAGSRQAPSSQYQSAAASRGGFWDYWGFKGCQNCHGYTPETLPPYGGHSPLPPGYSRRSGGSSGDSGDSAQSRREWSDRSQCNQQFEADREICQKAKSPKCWENQNKRLGHCSATGEVGTPALRFGPPGR
jgi:hypothetical protein